MTTPNLEDLPFDLVLTHSITIEPVDTQGTAVFHYDVVAWGPSPYGTSTRGDVKHVIGSAATYEEADAIRTPTWNVIHIARNLKNGRAKL